MLAISWENCPDVTRAQVLALRDGLLAAVGSDRAAANELVGLYLHGSLALGCFNPDASDIDVLGVTHAPLSATAWRACADALHAISGQPAPIEISLLAQPTPAPFVYPTPFAFHFGEGWRGRMNAPQPAVDPDLAVHIAVTRARGVTLHGPPAAQLLPEPPREALLASILQDIDSAEHGIAALALAPNPGNAILNACRTLAFLKTGRLLSKDEGAQWAVVELPWRHAGLAARALERYRAAADVVFDRAELTRFSAYAANEIRKMTGYVFGSVRMSTEENADA
jgi:streptomycin 3"-adenylyltransferase